MLKDEPKKQKQYLPGRRAPLKKKKSQLAFERCTALKTKRKSVSFQQKLQKSVPPQKKTKTKKQIRCDPAFPYKA